MIQLSTTLQRLFPSAICVFLGVVFATQDYILQARKSEPVTWNVDQLPFWFFWALLSPLIARLSRRYRSERQQWLRTLLAHLVASVTLASIYPILFILVWITGSNSPNAPLVSERLHFYFFINTLVFGIVIYWVILTIILALKYYGHYQEEMLRASRLKTQLAEAELQALKMQLHPHFLFNTLHSVTALVLKNENREAVRMISRLSELLRLAIRDTKTQLVPLRQELEFTERYLEIEQIRFRDRLTVQMNIDPLMLDAEVPNLILQPLVENAVRHAITPHSSASRIEIAATRRDGKLCLEVSDDGPGLPEDWDETKSEGVGLNNTRARLDQLYGDEYNFDISNGKEKGAVVRVAIPFRVIDIAPRAT